MAKYSTNISTQETASGLTYNILDTAGTQMYNFEDLKKIDIPTEPFDSYRGIISCCEINTKSFPNAANPREPDNKGVVVDMQTTLSLPEERTKFHRYNNGMTIVCSNLALDNGSGEFEIDFEYKDGIFNRHAFRKFRRKFIRQRRNNRNTRRN
ncbi:MAG: hypothetical protein VW862_06735 [Euryarchaeota archaeon]